jgi:hypothetical protein
MLVLLSDLAAKENRCKSKKWGGLLQVSNQQSATELASHAQKAFMAGKKAHGLNADY